MRSRLTCFFLAFWIFATPTTIQGDACPKLPSIVEVNETAPAGTEIFSTEKANVQWRLNVANTKFWSMGEFLELTEKGTAPETYYTLTVKKSLDVEELRDKYGYTEPAYIMVFFCRDVTKGEYSSEKNFNVVVAINVVNEFSPTFNTSNISVFVEEGVKDVPLVDLSQWASDEDIRFEKKEIHRYDFLEPKNPLLRIHTHNGKVSVKSPLDYEALPADQKYLSLKVAAWDVGEKMASTNLTVHVINIDDLPPRFTYEGCPNPCDSVSYGVQITPDDKGLLSGIKPAAIHAEDPDGLRSKITYSITNGPEGYEHFIEIDPTTAVVRIVKPMAELNKTLPVAIMVQAEEDTPKQRRSSTTLILTSDPWPPNSKTPSDVNPLYLIEATALFHVILVLLVVASFIYCGRRWRQKSLRNDASPLIWATALFHIILVLVVIAAFVYCGRRWREKSLPWNADEFKEFQLPREEEDLKKEDVKKEDVKEEEVKPEIPRTQSQFEKFRKRVASTTL